MEKQASILTTYIFDLNEQERLPKYDKIQKVNHLLMEVERDFTLPQGIPNRNWYKHLIFGARYTYAVLFLPALTEAAEAGDNTGITQSLNQLEEAVKKVISKLKTICCLLNTP